MIKTTAIIAVTCAFSALPCFAILGFNDIADINTLVFNNHSADGGDTEGRLAVGGNSNAVSTYSIGDRADPDSGSYTSYLVRGNANSFSHVYHGNVLVGGSLTTPGTGSYGVTANAGTSAVDAVFDFAGAATYMNNTSNYLAGLGNQGTSMAAYVDANSVLSVGSGSLSVYNMSAAELSTIDTWGVLDIQGMDLTKTLVINVEGAAIDVSSMQIYVNSHATGDWADSPTLGYTSITNSTTAEAPISRVLWNFYEATDIDMSQTEWAGSVLAPEASLTMTGGSINGDVVVKNAEQLGNSEFHHDNYNRSAIGISDHPGENIYGFTGTIPEPSSYVLVMAAWAAAITVCRRRRRV